MESNVAQLLSEAAAEDPERIALVEAVSGRTVTWRQLDELVDAVAAGLGRAGLVAGYRVGLALTNRIELVAAYLGALRARVVVVPLNPRGTPREHLRLVEDAGIRLILAEAASVDAVRQLGVDVVLVDDEGAGSTSQTRSWADLVSESGRPLPAVADAEALAVLLYTSGTSGPPRGAMLTHRALLANLHQAQRVEPAMVRPDDVVLGVLPLFHVYGLNAVLGQVLATHARMVLVGRFDAEEVLNIVADEAVTVLPLAPAAFARWRGHAELGDRLDSVRIVLSGSAPLSEEVVEEFTRQTGLPVHQGYGLTEAAPVVTSTLCSGHAPDPGSVGAALPGIQVEVREESGHVVEGGDTGEIWVRGENLFSGYWPDGADGPDPEGWFATGDLGYLEDGDLFLVDRLKEVVLVSGFNVYPTEVEDTIAEVEGVRACAVIGEPDQESGERVAAYVVPSGEGADLVERVVEHCATHLARFKQPAVVRVVDALPYTMTGKVQKGRLRQVARRRALGLLE